jgi:hypothetical protein
VAKAAEILAERASKKSTVEPATVPETALESGPDSCEVKP